MHGESHQSSPIHDSPKGDSKQVRSDHQDPKPGWPPKPGQRDTHVTGPSEDAQAPQTPEVPRLNRKSTSDRPDGRESGRRPPTRWRRSDPAAGRPRPGLSLLPARGGDGQEPAAAPHHQTAAAQRQPRGARHEPAHVRRSASFLPAPTSDVTQRACALGVVSFDSGATCLQSPAVVRLPCRLIRLFGLSGPPGQCGTQ